MEHGSLEWHQWRHEGIGSSDAPVVMGVSPWKTPYQLWFEKSHPLNIDEHQEPNFAQQRGINLEPKARATYELLNNIEMPATNLVAEKFDFIRASLDGYNASEKLILEIKCPGQEDHAIALNGRVPEKYLWQLMHQMYVAKAERAHYFSYYKGEGKCVEVRRDEGLIKTLLDEEIKFWELVLSEKPPGYSSKDYVPVEDGSLRSLIKRWKEKKIEFDQLGSDMKMLSGMIKEGASESRMVYEDVKLYHSERKGNVDYSKIPELKGVDLEIYRKPSIKSFTIRLGDQEE